MTITEIPATWLQGLGLAALMAMLQTSDGNACRAQIKAELDRRSRDHGETSKGEAW